MINKETIISVYDEKLTLLQWLKSVNKALDEAVLTNVEIEQRGNATFVFVFTFEDGTQVVSNEIVVNKGDSVESASIVNGHLILTLTNENTIDAGDIKPVSSFGFNSSRHLIVYYGDGTNQDLGLIKGVSGFSINSSGHLIVSYDNGTSEDLGSLGDFSNVAFVAKTLRQTEANFTATFSQQSIYGSVTAIYNRFMVINNVLHIIYNVKFTSNGYSIPSKDIVAYGQSSALTSDIASKIFDLNGNSVHEAGPYCTIAKVPAIITKGKLYNSDDILNCTLVLYNINAADYIGFYIMNDTGSAISLTNGDELYIMARMALTLL